MWQNTEHASFSQPFRLAIKYSVEVGNPYGDFVVEAAPTDNATFLYRLYLSVILVIVTGGVLYVIIYLKARKNK